VCCFCKRNVTDAFSCLCVILEPDPDPGVPPDFQSRARFILITVRPTNVGTLYPTKEYMSDFPDGSNYIDLNVVEDRDMRRLIQRMRRAEGYITDAELDAIRRFQHEKELSTNGNV
jgi:hypothetical protein